MVGLLKLSVFGVVNIDGHFETLLALEQIHWMYKFEKDLPTKCFGNIICIYVYNIVNYGRHLDLFWPYFESIIDNTNVSTQLGLK